MLVFYIDYMYSRQCILLTDDDRIMNIKVKIYIQTNQWLPVVF